MVHELAQGPEKVRSTQDEMLSVTGQTAPVAQVSALFHAKLPPYIKPLPKMVRRIGMPSWRFQCEFPQMPGDDTAIRYPNGGDSNDGKSLGNRSNGP